MNTLANHKKPPFYTALYMTGNGGADEGLYSDAISTMLSLAMILTGFLGCRDDRSSDNRIVKIVFWKNYQTMKAWERTASDLIPHRVRLQDCIASKGCLWQWLDDGSEKSAASMIKAA